MTEVSIIWIAFLAYLYVFKIGYVTPLSVFIGLSSLYVMFVPILYGADSKLFNIVVDSYAKFDASDLFEGILMFLIYCAFALYIDHKLIKQMTTKNGSVLNSINNKKVLFKGVNIFFVALLSFAVGGYIYGIYSYGLESYFHGYNESIGTNYGGIGNAIITMCDVLFFLSCTALAKHSKISKYTIYLVIVLYAIPHFAGGGRLMFVVGLMGFIFVQNNFIIKLNKKILLLGAILFALFAAIGTLRTGGGQLYDGILEFAFVGFGYYNIISYKNFYDAMPLNVIQDVIIFSLPAVFDKSEYISKMALLKGLGISQVDLSPVGGSFYLTDLYLYLGAAGFFAALLIPIFFKILIMKHLRMVNSIRKLFFGLFVALFVGFVSINLIRNGILPASSALLKSLVIYILLLILSGHFDKVFGFKSK